MDRRRFLASTAGVTTAALSLPWLSTAGAATDDELAFANFGVSAELLLEDFYAKALDVKGLSRTQAAVLRRGRTTANQHAKALAGLLTGAGESAPIQDDFEFVWPEDAFGSPAATVSTGLVVLRALLGSYQTAAASVLEPSYRVLHASLAASIGQQIGALSGASGRAGAEPFPVAVDLEAASSALEAYLG